VLKGRGLPGMCLKRKNEMPNLIQSGIIIMFTTAVFDIINPPLNDYPGE